MKTRRLRLARPRWTLGTMLLVVGWSAVVVWLNVRPRVEYEASVKYGYPWTSYVEPWEPLRTSDSGPGYVINELVPPPQYDIRYWHLAANIAIGLLAVALLTFASKYLVRAIIAGLRAVLSKATTK